MNVLQIAALSYLLFYAGILLGFRSYLLYKGTGINPLSSRKTNGLEGFIESIFRFCFFLICVVVINFVFIENNYKLLVPITYLEREIVGYLGILISSIGLIFSLIAQLQMGDSWRLGLNENETTKLINHNIYAYSRNPIYLGYLVSIVGFFMIMPNAISLCLLALSIVSIGMKVRLEEVYLLNKLGTEYQSYVDKVRRWI